MKSSNNKTTQPSNFFSYVIKLKEINRWPLNRTIYSENVAEHSMQVSAVAHMLAIIYKKNDNTLQIEPENIAIKALFHDISETITGDLPTTIKYHNPSIEKEYKKIELDAINQITTSIPKTIQSIYSHIINSQFWSDKEKQIIKDADVLCAYIKANEEVISGNKEFIVIKERINKQLNERMNPSIQYFINTFI